MQTISTKFFKSRNVSSNLQGLSLEYGFFNHNHRRNNDSTYLDKYSINTADIWQGILMTDKVWQCHVSYWKYFEFMSWSLQYKENHCFCNCFKYTKFWNWSNSFLWDKCLNINPFSTNVPLLYPLKTSENRRLMFSGSIEVEHWLKMG